MRCFRCGSRETVKSGFVRDVQRYKCKECGYHYTTGRSRFSEEAKVLALTLYTDGCSLRQISRSVGASAVTVMHWVRKAGEGVMKGVLKRKHKFRYYQRLELDELCTFIGKKNEKPGCGWLLIELPEGSSLSGLVVVAQPA